MTPERHARIKEIFLAVVSRPEGEREAALAEACGGDSELRTEIERLIAHHHGEDPFTIPASPLAPTEVPRKNPPNIELNERRSRAKEGPAPEQFRGFKAGDIVADRFRIVALLGQGGMGAVYRAEDLTLKQTVALKFLYPQYGDDPDWIERFYREARTARMITHPNVCRVFDIGQCEGSTFISMEYVDGETLAGLLKRIGRVPLDRAREVCREICFGLAAAHVQGVLHRDLKPSNIMLDGAGIVRITDFGLASLIEDIQEHEIRAGTPAYMSPEQFAGRELTVKSDIYSLGLVIYELLAGRPTFTADSVPMFAQLHKQESPKPLSELVPDVDPSTESVVLSCLAKRPARRPESALAVAAALANEDILSAAMAAQQTPTPTMVADAEPRYPARGRPGVRLAAAIILLCTFGAVRTLHPIALERSETRSPAVLVDRAREIIAIAGYGLDGNGHATFGFCPPDDVQRFATGVVGPGDREVDVGPQGDSDAFFWYRRAQDWRDVNTSRKRIGSGASTIHFVRPVIPGLATVILDRSGRLLFLSGLPLPPQVMDSGTDRPPGDRWTALLDRAGFQLSDLSESDFSTRLPIEVDDRRAWVGRNGDGSGVRIEAAATGSYAVYFSRLRDKGESDWSAFVMSTDRRIMVRMATLVILIALAVVSIPLAVVNYRADRCDRRGALMLSVTAFLIMMSVWFLQAERVPSIVHASERLFTAALECLGAAALMWLYYIALEPHARRYWPHILVSWNRVLAGRIRDRLTGQHLQVGLIVGIGLSLLMVVDRWLTESLGWIVRPTLIRDPIFDEMLGGRFAVAGCLESFAHALIYGLLFLLLLTVLRSATHRPRTAALLSVALLAPMFTPFGSHPATAWFTVGVCGVGAAVWVLTRFGLLALVVALFVTAILNDASFVALSRSWQDDQNLFVLGILAAIGLYGLVAARGPSVRALSTRPSRGAPG